MVVWLLLLSFVFQMAGCGGGDRGESSSGGGSNDSGSATIVIDGASTFIPYQVASVKVSNATLTEDTYEAQIDGSPVAIFRLSSDTLTWIMPDLATGNHTITLQIGASPVSASFYVTAGATVAEPDVFINDTVTDISSLLDTQIGLLMGVSGEEATLAKLQAIKDELTTQMANVSALSESDKLWVANVLNANIGSVDALSAQSLKAIPFNEQECWDAAKEYTYSVIKTKSIIAITAIAVIVGPTTGVGTVLTGISVGLLAIKVDDTLKLQDSALNLCLGRTVDTLSAESTTNAAPLLFLIGNSRATSPTTAAALSFTHGTAQSFHIVSSYSFFSAEFKSALETLKSEIASVVSILPDAWVSTIQNATAGDTTEISDPSTYSISGISDANITVEKGTVGDKISLKFSYIEPKLTPTSFTFNLVDSRDGLSTPFSATLNYIIDHITITPATPSVDIGKTVQLTAKAYDASNNEIAVPSSEYSWSSANPAIATADASGMLSGVSEGSTTITVTHVPSGKSAIVRVKVQGIDHITITPATPSVGIGKTVQLTAKAYDASNNEISVSSSEYSWSSDNTGIATVNSSGSVTGVSWGSATITVLHVHTGKQATVGISVADYSVDHITISSATSIAVGEAAQITVSAYDYMNNEISVPASEFSWSSENTSIATVNSSGIVTGVSEGSTIITVTHVPSGNSGSVDVFVVSTDPREGWYMGSYSIQQHTVFPAPYAGATGKVWIYIFKHPDCIDGFCVATFSEGVGDTPNHGDLTELDDSPTSYFYNKFRSIWDDYTKDNVPVFQLGWAAVEPGIGITPWGDDGLFVQYDQVAGEYIYWHDVDWTAAYVGMTTPADFPGLAAFTMRCEWFPAGCGYSDSMLSVFIK